MTDADYADNLVLLTNPFAQAKFLLYSLKQAAEGIDIYVNANQTEYMSFKHEDAISNLRNFR